MTVLELMDRRLRPAVLGAPGGREARAVVRQALRTQLVEVVARPLLAVEWSLGPQDWLTALDGTGQVVTVGLLERLDAAALVAAMARQGEASLLGRVDLAARYPGGAAALARDLRELGDVLPARTTVGAAVTLVAGEITDDVRASLSVLSGQGVEVLEAVVRELDGRVLVQVEPVRGAPTIAGALLVERGGRRAVGGRRSRRVEPTSQYSLAQSAAVTGGQLPTGGDQAGSSRADQAGASQVASGDSQVASGDSQGPSGDAAGATSTGREVEEEPSVVPARRSRRVIPSPAEPRPDSIGTQPAAGSVQAGGETVASQQAAASVIPAGDGRGASLADVVAVVDTPAVLLWRSLRRGIHTEAVLEATGHLVLEDGRVFTDPSAAADAVAGGSHDGWRVWRLGGDGRSLGELLGR